MKKIRPLIITTLIMVLLFTGYAALADEYGSKDDPLVSLSYINEVLMPQTLSDIDDLIEEKTADYLKEVAKEVDDYGKEFESLSNDTEFIEKVANKISNQTSTEAVSLASGQKITLSAGSEVIVRTGEGKFSANFLNVTTGTATLADEVSALNNLYLAVEESVTFSATTATTLIVSGSYS